MFSLRKENNDSVRNDTPEFKKDPNPKGTVKSFVAESPSAKYILDSPKRDTVEADLCRQEPDGSKRCIKVALQSRALFSTMQSLGFYCALPFDPKHTEIECTPMPK
ncbi:uncharacterized protein EI90DRAFT_3131702 [Cantharellus anzutake]|uniref:uncharacterized protein n=1 Tax=Cantharellus anzutake TaxID=1750568 RepID=UPI001905F9C1|nr:uncharacterized protein EI90DRAFT_3131702 [Cantharellus anzutake]KAF8321439.1 hypothetical protein EI90DRAFT_3131702 [Cantharellus anzutake]